MSNTVRDFEYESGDFTSEDWYHEADLERGVDYLGDGNNDTEENDGFVIIYEDQTLDMVVDGTSEYPLE